MRWDGVLETGEYGRVVLIRDLFVVSYGLDAVWTCELCESVCEGDGSEARVKKSRNKLSQNT